MAQNDDSLNGAKEPLPIHEVDLEQAERVLSATVDEVAAAVDAIEKSQIVTLETLQYEFSV